MDTPLRLVTDSEHPLIDTTSVRGFCFTRPMEQHVRSAGRYRLADELEQFARDRDTHKKPERATAAREAVAVLLAGAASVDFEGVTYLVGDDDRYTIRPGTRDEVLASLRDGAVGAAHFASGRREDQYHAAIAAIEAGAERVRVGHLEYIVTCNAE